MKFLYVICEGVSNLKSGDKVWVVERMEDYAPCEVTCFVLLAITENNYGICAPVLNKHYDLDFITKFHARETCENMDTSLCVFPMEDIYETVEEANRYLIENEE